MSYWPIYTCTILQQPVRNTVKKKALDVDSTFITCVFYMLAAGDNRLGRDLSTTRKIWLWSCSWRKLIFYEQQLGLRQWMNFYCFCMPQLFCTVYARQSLDLTFQSHCDQRINNGHPQSCARPNGDLFYYTILLIIGVKHMMFASVLLILFLAYILECMHKYHVQKVWIICL